MIGKREGKMKGERIRGRKEREIKNEGEG